MLCSSCLWYVAKKSENGEVYVGRCRKHAPALNGYPVVFPSDWCGDHKLDENSFIR